MKFKDFELRGDNHFIAMQYYGLILNRTFLILLTDDLLVGIKANGLIGAESGGNGLAKEILKSLSVRGDLNNPYSYVKSKYVDNIKDCDILDGSILQQNKSNFLIKRSDIKNVYHDPKKKWGMGYYPHDGKVYIQTVDGTKKEFIVLGNQSGHNIANLILTM